MAPRAPVPGRKDASTDATDAASPGRTTSAVVGAVRPQPVRTSRAIDAGREQHRPYRPEQQDRPVPEHHVLGGTTGPGLEQQGVAQDRQHEGSDRELEVDVATGGKGRLLEGPEAVGGDGHPSRETPDEAQELLRVGSQGAPVANALEFELAVVDLALPSDHEQGAERGDDEEPVREGDPRGEAACDGPNQKPRGDGREVEDRFALEPYAVGEVDGDVDADGEGELNAEDRGPEPDRQGQQRDRGPCSRPEAHDPGGHRTATLLGMQAVDLMVESVVHEVGPACGEAEDPECRGASAQRSPVGEDPRSPRGGEDE